jgi:hypothetical protein
MNTMITNSPDSNDPIANELKDLFSTCGSNKHDHAIVGITACIEAGIVTRRGIMDTLSRAGLSPKHVVITLNGETGSDPVRHRWQHDEDGVYRNLP